MILYYIVLGPVAKFLSFPFYNPLSRISYCLYLVHRITELTRIAAVRVPIYFNNYLIVSIKQYLLKKLKKCVCVYVLDFLIFKLL